MAIDTTTCNLSLGHLAVTKKISNAETDRSQQALACREFYQPSLKEVFRDFVWPFATRYVDLGLIVETPNDDWAFSYRYPANCSRLHKLLSGVRNDTRQSRVPYELGSDDTAKLIFTDLPNATAKYTKFITDSGYYHQDFIMMHSLLLASYIAPQVAAGDPFNLGKRAYEFYTLSKIKAQGNSMNEQQDDELPESEFIRDRE